MFSYVQIDLTYRQRQELIARCHQVRTGQDGQAGIRMNEKGLSSHGKERVDNSRVR